MIPLKISAATGQGITELLRRLSEDLAAVRAREPVPAEWVRTIRGPAGEDMDEAGEDVAEDDGARTVGAGAGAAAADQAGAGAGRPEVRTFAELVDAGARLGSMPWPRRFYIDTAPAGGEEESEE